MFFLVILQEKEGFLFLQLVFCRFQLTYFIMTRIVLHLCHIISLLSYVEQIHLLLTAHITLLQRVLNPI